MFVDDLFTYLNYYATLSYLWTASTYLPPPRDACAEFPLTRCGVPHQSKGGSGAVRQ